MAGRPRNGNIKKAVHALALRKAAEAGWRCHWCGEPLIPELTTADHVTPLHAGGSDDATNIVPACYPCNSARNNGVEQFAGRLEQVLMRGLMARKLHRLAVQHDQLVIWLAEIGYPLPMEMRDHLVWLALQTEQPDWPKSRRHDVRYLLGEESDSRLIALHSLEQLHGRPLPTAPCGEPASCP